MQVYKYIFLDIRPLKDLDDFLPLIIVSLTQLKPQIINAYSTLSWLMAVTEKDFPHRMPAESNINENTTIDKQIFHNLIK